MITFIYMNYDYYHKNKVSTNLIIDIELMVSLLYDRCCKGIKNQKEKGYLYVSKRYKL